LAEAINIQFPLSASGNNLSGRDDVSILIRECIAQSRSAQKKLYDQYAPMAYGVIRRYMYNNEAIAQELLNDCFYKIFLKLEQYNYQGSFEGWIRRLVVNTVTDHLRKKIKDDEVHKEVQPEDAYVDSESVGKLSHKELLRVIETLPDTHRAVFNLFVFENYTHNEISKLLNITENNCRWYLNNARKRLKEKLNSIME
jgi:RNA polymerase sigma factor (sigma-70 family)